MLGSLDKIGTTFGFTALPLRSDLAWRYDERIRPAPPDIYISADVETDGPIPGPFSMLSLGLCVAGEFDGTKYERRNPDAETFYVEIKPTSDKFEEKALAVNGLDRTSLERNGSDPKVAMDEVSRWIRRVSEGFRPVLVAYPVAFDWSFINWYFVTFASDDSPFGYASCLDIRSLYMAKANTLFERSGKRDMPNSLQTKRPHSHNALDDSIEQAELFSNIFEWSPANELLTDSSALTHP